jgi:hypothetical protein
MTPALRAFVQEEHAMVRQGDLPRHGPLAAADHDNIRSRMVQL